jgi:succinate dehydrogenase/fumarate reductase flavoprotein subunit/uncharacterized protein with FMN-binding domain
METIRKDIAETEKVVSGLSRRDFLAGALTASAGAMVLGSMVGCSSKNTSGTSNSSTTEDQGLTPGAYASIATGKNGEVPVSVLVSSNQLLAVNVGTNSETTQFGAKAIAEIPIRMVDEQCVEVDTFSGATVTSSALTACIQDCLEQAGNATAFSEKSSTAATEISLVADVVVVGSGISGQAAALSAVQNSAKVIMLDRLSLTGGAATGSGGAILAANSPLQIAAGGVTDTQLLVDHLYRYSEYQASEEMIAHIVAHSAEIIQWYTDLGVSFQLGTTAGALNNMQFSHRAYSSSSFSGSSSGSNIFNKTYPAFVAAGGVTMLNTPASELIQDSNGKITGIKATNGNDTYNIACDAVVLAAGGYEYKEDKLEEWSPHCGLMMVDTSCHCGDYGNGIDLGLDVGGYFVGHGYGQCTNVYTPIPAIKVTEAGERYSNEMHSEDAASGNQGTQFKAFFDAGIKWAYTLFDSSTPDESAKKVLDAALANADSYADQGMTKTKKKYYRGSTIEEVANAAGVDSEGLVATVKKWNNYVTSGVDADFGVDNPSLYGTYEDGPFYLLPYTMVINGTIGGLKVDYSSRVLREDGTAVEGLYAAGETCNGEYMYRLYPSGGASLLYGSVSGKIAGVNAAILANGGSGNSVS